MIITFDTVKQKVLVQATNDIPYYIGLSNAEWTIQNVLDYMFEGSAWHAEWTTDVGIEEMLLTKISDTVAMEALGNITIR